MDIAQLVTLAQQGDEQAKSKLLHLAAEWVYARMFLSVRSSEAADDLAQDALVAALTGLPRLRNPRAFLPWLRRITENVLADYRRGRARTSGEVELARIPSREDADRTLAKAEEWDNVRAALSALPTRNRLAVELFYFHELSCRQVASFLRISHDAARAVLSRSRKELRRRMMTMTHAEGPRTRSRLTVVSGTPHLRPSTVLEMGSDMERLYTALYPLGDAQAAGAAAGLSDERAREALQALQDMGFVARQHKNWRCAIPIANGTDGEMVRIWAEPIANVVIARLESLHEEGVALAELVEGDLARSTVMTFGLIEAARRPFQALEEQMRVSTPDRGRFGQFSVAVFTHEVPGQKSVLHGGLSCSEHETTDGAPYCAYFFHPSVTRRPGIKDLDAAFPFLDDGHPVSEKVLDRLAPFARGLVTADVRAGVADSLSVPRPRHDEFWRRLAQLHAVGGAGEETRLAVPLLPLATWKDYLSLLDGLKAEIAERVADAAEDLRARTLRCSFAHCNFADTVLVFFTYLQGLVNEAIASRNWLTMPKEADYSWGALMAV